MQLYSRVLTTLGVALFLVGYAVPAMADSIIYNQPWDGTGNAYASQHDTFGANGNVATVYDDFMLGVNSTVTDVNWIGEFIHPPQMDPIIGFTLTFWSNIGGQPGSMLYQDVQLGNGNQSACAPVSGLTTCSYSENLTTAFAAQAGTTYWLSIVPNFAAPPYALPEWGWATGNGPGGPAYQDIFGNRNQIQADLAFSLSGSSSTPEPFTLGMMGAGLAVLGLAKFRRNRA